jgi:hypothetical protein
MVVPMTALARHRRRPKPYPNDTARANAERDRRIRAEGQLRADRSWVAARLEQFADKLAATRSTVRQEIAGEIRALADDIEESRR